MSNLVSAIYDDMKAYKIGCQKLREEMQKDWRGYPDCYSDHAKDVARRLSHPTRVIENYSHDGDWSYPSA
ncbi:MAG: hypothetical protein VBE63_31265 [Lamprobacter sp.]|uniref:hypothetical protein n=1 Tax=Lamprobacter sp. TaxID=3100796 RepID=UPI002B25B98C|nr:hypothetical protein [Lamprobacter sp.]MEA3644370.1 hypothetical protein [Lamprobacter sp.]